jgi:hypothetical protein
VTSEGRLWQRLAGDGPHWCFDVGVYGVPSARGYRCFTSVRAVQAAADSPTQWGLSYMTKGEMQAPDGVLNAAAYAAVRRAYGAEGAFPPLWEKAAFYDPATSVDGPVIRCWRLKRDGIYGLCMGCGVALLAVVLALAWLLVAPERDMKLA